MDELNLILLGPPGAGPGRSARGGPEAVRERLRVYHDQTAPLVPYYQGRGLLRSVDGLRPVPEVYEQLRESIERPVRTGP